MLDDKASAEPLNELTFGLPLAKRRQGADPGQRKGLTKREAAGYSPGSLVLHPTDRENVELALASTNVIEHVSLP